MSDRVPATLQVALADLTRWLDTERIPGMVIGGVAASVLGRPRLTRDIDALAILPEADWADVVDVAARYGFAPRSENALEFARRSRVLLMRHMASAIDLDIIVGGLPFELSAIERRSRHILGDTVITLPRIEDLLVMKAVARRPRDIEDIRGLLDANPEADVTEARRWIREFARASEMPDMLKEFDELLARHEKS